MGKWLLLDGFNLAFRSYYGIPDLKTQAGFSTNAIYGWIRTIWKLQDRFKPDQLIIILDAGRSKMRSELLPSYKANRKETPQSLIDQLNKIKELMEALGLPVIQMRSVEADDVIASLAKRLSLEGREVYIVSSDKDLSQCIDPQVRQIIPAATAFSRQGFSILDETSVLTKFGVSVHQIVDYLSLIGDASDNIPGITGVGPKTAQKWIQEWGSVDGILQNLDTIKPERFRAILQAGTERLKLNRALISLDTELEVQLPDYTPENSSKVEDLFRSLEMHTTFNEHVRRKKFAELI
jgi:DNA polymerase-1